jgi:asparagine synthase (glutamine-hydrolysing)
MFSAMVHRGSGTADVSAPPGALIGAARHDWESSLSGWSGPLIAEDEEWIVAADATLYYLDDLRRRLRVSSKEQGTGALLLAALRLWGSRFAEFVEGDYAIMAWQRPRQRLLLARDFGGRRSLFYTRAGHSTIVASSTGALVNHPDVTVDYDVGFIAASASGLVGPGDRTAYRQIETVSAGSTLAIESTASSEVFRWSPPPSDTSWNDGLSATAAEELRFLLQDATRERMATTGPTTVWMSGGWDSTAVFASGSSVRSQGRHSSPVLPISMTYPTDDLGNEDAHIRAVAARWNVPVTWVETDQIRLIADSERRARLHDDPMVQPFESQMRKLCQVSRSLDSRVALDGFGGDHIFLASSAAVVADHLFYGRWNHLLREYRYWRMSAREFARLTLLPHLSTEVRNWIGAVRGRPLDGFWDRSLPTWIRPSSEVLAELSPEIEREQAEGAGDYELRRGIGSQLIGRAVSWNTAFGLDEGVQLRAPLFDARVVAFAVSRPLSDRGSAGDGKRLLRQSMASLIPASVLAPRLRKTGTPVDYFKRQFQLQIGPEVERLFRRRSSCLDRMGILDLPVFLTAADEYAAKGVHLQGAMLHFTLEAERWLAVREGTSLSEPINSNQPNL